MTDPTTPAAGEALTAESEALLTYVMSDEPPEGIPALRRRLAAIARPGGEGAGGCCGLERFAFDAGDTGECGWVCPFGKGAHPARSTHYFVPRGMCECGHGGDQHPGDGGCTSKRGCDCDMHAARPVEARVEALRVALEAICAAHHDDPDGGMGYLPSPEKYGHYEHACVVCGTSDEYAVAWPCWTWVTANAALAALAAPDPAATPCDCACHRPEPAHHCDLCETAHPAPAGRGEAEG